MAAPGRPLSELPLLSAAERSQLAAWNAETERERPAELLGATLPELFAAQVLRTPAALVALIAGEDGAAELRGAGRADGRRWRAGCGLWAWAPRFWRSRSSCRARAELIVALLATHAAGGFYVPLDPAYPAERLSFMLGIDSGAAVVT